MMTGPGQVRDDDTEESDQKSGGGDVDQVVYGGGRVCWRTPGTP